jgi:hypothetical protein
MEHGEQFLASGLNERIIIIILFNFIEITVNITAITKKMHDKPFKRKNGRTKHVPLFNFYFSAFRFLP